MGSPRPAESPAGDRPLGRAKGGATRLILLAEPGSGVERTLVKRWLREAHIRPSAVVPLDGPGLARSLDASPPDTVITAARVAWLPPEREGERRARPG
jgi:glycerol-3-phosphate O-acyltransferase